MMFLDWNNNNRNVNFKFYFHKNDCRNKCQKKCIIHTDEFITVVVFDPSSPMYCMNYSVFVLHENMHTVLCEPDYIHSTSLMKRTKVSETLHQGKSVSDKFCIFICKIWVLYCIDGFGSFNWSCVKESIFMRLYTNFVH